jgi:hypothetical protein
MEHVYPLVTLQTTQEALVFSKMLLMELPTVTHVDHLITLLVASCQHSQVDHINGALVGTMLD